MVSTPDAVWTRSYEKAAEDRLLSYWGLEHKFKPCNKSNRKFSAPLTSRGTAAITMSFDSAWLLLRFWIASMLMIWPCILCVLQQKEGKYYWPISRFCKLREEPQVCDGCSLHIQYFQTLSKWILHARYNTMPANNVNIAKLCGCNFHICRQLSFGAKKEDNALQLSLTGVKNVISIWILFYVPTNPPLLPKKWTWSHSVYFLFEITVS